MTRPSTTRRPVIRSTFDPRVPQSTKRPYDRIRAIVNAAALENGYTPSVVGKAGPRICKHCGLPIAGENAHKAGRGNSPRCANCSRERARLAWAKKTGKA